MDRFRSIASMNIRPAITQDKEPRYKGTKMLLGAFLLFAGMLLGMALGMVM